MDNLSNLIEHFSINKLQIFFMQKISNFKPDKEDYGYLFKNNDIDEIENYQDIVKIGEADLTNSDDLIVIAAKTLSELTSRTGKKKQYEIAKKILKVENKDAAFFIFYDDDGSFRFSFIKANFIGAKRDFTNFKRYTYFVSRKLTNKTFRNQISKCNFNDLNNILEAFSVEPITKEFYEKLQHWYFWAIKNVKFPPDAEKETNGRQSSVIRLITRMMFIWFMKVRNLVPDNLFEKAKIKEILRDCSDNQSTYYQAILQNLFFATLNTEQRKRKFRSEKRGAKGYNPDYGNHHVYRYHNLFKNDNSLIGLFEKIPFLNGGLFACLDYKTKEKEERKYIDGFTDTKGQQPKVPNFLFFSEPIKVDLSYFLNGKNQTYEVEGLINLFKNYNFTIDENEPDDIEIALDPELLGSVFENLLASYNPETATTARKATGSFYTPREIVSYMVDESLKQYFRSNIGNESILLSGASTAANTVAKASSFHGQNTSKQDTFETLFDAHSENPFDQAVTGKLINLINGLRVVDPAVGSGAFPMAVLKKLVFILSKLDPQNTYWQQSQIDSVKKYVDDPIIQRKLVAQIEQRFKEKNADYGRKLYLIEKCIYGVDIQQIAVEIAKLRFFISLLVDEKIDFDKPNYNIQPLPNLDFKIMQGNSLISTFAGIDFNAQANQTTPTISFDDEYHKLVKKFQKLKDRYQNEFERENKERLKKEINETIIEIFEERINPYLPELKSINDTAAEMKFTYERQREDYIAAEKRKLIKKRGFDIEQIEKDFIAYTEGRKLRKFFLWNVYFAEVFSSFSKEEISEGRRGKSGFDIVIGNPPYIQLQKAINTEQKFADLYKNENYKTFERTGDIYALFYEKGIDILTEKGLLCYITSNKWMRANYGKSLRRFFSKNNPLKLVDLGPGVFNAATVDTNILLIEKGCREQKRLKALTVDQNTPPLQGTPLKEGNVNDKNFIVLTELSEDSWIILTPEEQKIKQKIEHIGTPLKYWDINIYRGVLTGYNEAFIIDGKTKDMLIAKDPKSAEIIKPILRGRDIKRYEAKFADLWLINTHNGYKNSKGKRILPININNYPAIKEHLNQYWDKLEKRQDKGKTPYNLRNCAYLEEFEKEKIVWASVGANEYCYVEKEYFLLDTNYFAVGLSKYHLSILNSQLIITKFIKETDTQVGAVAYRHYKYNFEKIPIPKIPQSQQKPFEVLANKIISKKERGEDVAAEEQEIDLMVYKLYGLTYNEVKIIDQDFCLTKQEYGK